MSPPSRQCPEPTHVADPQQLQLSVVWADTDLHEVVAEVRGEHFSGVTSLYVIPGELAGLADKLSGFPTSRSDRRTFTLGQADLSGYGQIKVTFSCRDSTGHLSVYVEMRRAPSDPIDEPESCTVLLQAVPSSIDNFVRELRSLTEEGLSATLRILC